MGESRGARVRRDGTAFAYPFAVRGRLRSGSECTYTSTTFCNSPMNPASAARFSSSHRLRIAQPVMVPHLLCRHGRQARSLEDLFARFISLVSSNSSTPLRIVCNLAVTPPCELNGAGVRAHWSRSGRRRWRIGTRSSAVVRLLWCESAVVAAFWGAALPGLGRTSLGPVYFSAVVEQLANRKILWLVKTCTSPVQRMLRQRMRSVSCSLI